MLMFLEDGFKQGSYIKVKEDWGGQKYKVVHA